MLLNFRQAIITILLTLALGGTAFAAPKADPSWISSFEQVNQFFSEDPKRTIEDLLPRIDPKMRSNYLLAYASKSQVGSSFLKPRVILASPDGKFILSYAGDPSARGGDQIEMIQVNPKTQQPEFRAVEFADKVASVNHSPSACMGCHGAGGSAKSLRHIWDTYPDWPGFYGTAHNGSNFGTGSEGTSSLPHFEYEKNNFKKFLETQADDPRFKHLIGLKEQTLEKLATRNDLFTDQVAHLNGMRLMDRIASSKAFSKNATRIELYLHGVPNYMEELNFKPDDAKVQASVQKYYDDKAKRVLSLVEKYGTDADKALVKNGLPFTTELSHYISKKEIALAAFDTKPVSSAKTAWFKDYVEQNLGISLEDMSTARFSGQFAMATGKTNIYSGSGVKTQLGDAYNEYFKLRSTAHPPNPFDGEKQVLRGHLKEAVSASELTDMLDVDDFFLKSAHPDRVKFFKEETKRSIRRLVDLSSGPGDAEAFRKLKLVDAKLDGDLNLILDDLPTWKQKPKRLQDLSEAITTRYSNLKTPELFDEFVVNRGQEILHAKGVSEGQWADFLKTKGLKSSQIEQLKQIARAEGFGFAGLDAKQGIFGCFVNAIRNVIPRSASKH